MKLKKFASMVLATASILVLTACGNQGSTGNSTGSKDTVVTSVKKGTTVKFWHAMNGVQEEALTKIASDFEKENPNIKIKLQNQSSYPDLQQKIQATFTDKNNLPTISQAYPGWLYDAAESGLLVDLKPYMTNKKIGWGKQEKVMPALLEGAEIKGKQYGIPFNKSTEVLVYNKDLFDKYGVKKVPTTMAEYAATAKKIWEESNHTVVGGGFDSLNNFYVIGMKNKGVDFNKNIDITTKKSKQLVKYYADGIKDGYFRIAGSDKYLSTPFASEKVAMFIGSMAGEGFVAKDAQAGGYEYGVAPRPEKTNIQQGTDIYMFNKGNSTKNKNEQTGAYLFMKYLASKDVQLYWAEKTGYMPVLKSVINSDEYKNLSAIKTPAILADATKDLFPIPATKNQDPAYSEVRTILEKILTNPKQDIGKALKEGQTSLEDVWNQ